MCLLSNPRRRQVWFTGSQAELEICTPEDAVEQSTCPLRWPALKRRERPGWAVCAHFLLLTARHGADQSHPGWLAKGPGRESAGVILSGCPASGAPHFCVAHIGMGRCWAVCARTKITL